MSNEKLNKKNRFNLPSILSDNEGDILQYMTMQYDPRTVKRKATQELMSKKIGDELTVEPSGFLGKAMTLNEFHHGVLMGWALPETYQSFAVQLSRDYQNQYKCDSEGKKSLAELSAVNYCRILIIQRKINAYLSKNELHDLGLKYVAILSKELDRAQRHYLTSMQALEMGLQQPLTVSIRTNTANVATQQAIQQVGEQTNVKG